MKNNDNLDVLTSSPRLVHVTLNTLHTRISVSDEVNARVLAVVQDDIACALAAPRGKQIAIAGGLQSGCGMTAVAAGSALVATAWRGSAPLVTIGVAADDATSDVLWRLLHDTLMPLRSDASQPPSVPWLAARLEPGLAVNLDDAKWLGDWERCVAWGWLVKKRTS